jgi:hypothetical protein
MTQHLPIFVCLTLLLGSATATATDGEPQGNANTKTDDIITSAWADPDSCNIESAMPASIDDVHANSSALEGKCIAVRGFWRGVALFERQPDARKPKSISREDLHTRMVGVYARDEILASAPRRATRTTIVGILRRCETAWPGAVMVMGYCHYSTGPFLLASQFLEGRQAAGKMRP